VCIFSTSSHPLTLLLNTYQRSAKHGVSRARENLITDEKPQIRQVTADDSAWKMSVLHQNLPSVEHSESFHPLHTKTEVHSIALKPNLRSAAEDISDHNVVDSGKRGDESLASDTDSLSSSAISSDQDQDVSTVESHIAREMAAETLALLDRLESSVLVTYDELRSPSVNEDVANMLQLILQGYFFTNLWPDILSFYRCAIFPLYVETF